MLWPDCVNVGGGGNIAVCDSSESLGMCTRQFFDGRLNRTVGYKRVTASARSATRERVPGLPRTFPAVMS